MEAISRLFLKNHVSSHFYNLQLFYYVPFPNPRSFIVRAVLCVQINLSFLSVLFPFGIHTYIFFTNLLFALENKTNDFG